MKQIKIFGKEYYVMDKDEAQTLEKSLQLASVNLSCARSTFESMQRYMSMYSESTAKDLESCAKAMESAWKTQLWVEH